MATSDDGEFQALEEIFILDYISVSLAGRLVAKAFCFPREALVIYEHLLTLQREIRLIWKGPANIASTVFIANHYVALIYVLCGLVTLNPNSSCASGFAETIINQVCYLILTTIFAFFAALRVYAIWDRNRVLFFLTASIGFIPVVANFYVLVSYETVEAPGVTCVIASRIPLDILNRTVALAVGIVTRISSTLIDVVVLALTWIKLSSSWHRIRGHHSPSISDILLRNGCFCFVTLLHLNIAEIIIHQLTTQTYITYIITIVASILVSRFILDILDVRPLGSLPGAGRHWYTQTADVSGISSFVSNLGQDFSHAVTLNERGVSFGPIDS
ncbi:hypothetical protein BC629DRAFT_1611282 [Irpex lacteus]|nr:hypothetical protein BC629DRAFT_1611282 [Irpex lacteus]